MAMGAKDANGQRLRLASFEMRIATAQLLLVLFLPGGGAHTFVWPAGAPRYWPRFGGSRVVRTLDGVWKYGFLDGGSPAGVDFDSMSPFFDPKVAVTPNTTTVPSCSDVVAGGAPGYMGPRGVAMYRTEFVAPANGTAVRLQFQACSFYCRIYVNGIEVNPPQPAAITSPAPGHRAGGYVAFYVDAPAALLKSGVGNELFVLADNRFNHTTAPMHTGGDFWHYGGLMRSVELHTMATDGRPVLWRAYVLPTGAKVEGGVANPDSVEVTLKFSDSTDDGKDVSFTFAFDDSPAVPLHGTVYGDSVVIRGVKVPNPKLWSPEHPNLHTLTVTLRGGSVTERFGLRAFGVDQGRITINGNVVKLVGWNHHTQWPVTAASPTDAQLDADVALLKKAGFANYVRGAHYPHDPRMMDRLDEAGILFWSETLGPSVSTANMHDWNFFMPYQLQQLEQMLNNALNHASVLTWGWFNEGPSDKPENCPAYAACANYTRARDPTRFHTWADDKRQQGSCYEHASLVAFNNYPGWYNNKGDLTSPKRSWDSDASFVSGKLKKPFVISETGAGGIFEWSANASTNVTSGGQRVYPQWSLAYQAQVVSADVNTAIANAKISGITLWHFFDFKVDDGEEQGTHCQYDHPPPETFADLARYGPPNCTYIAINNRPGGENHKGSLDFWRRPKPAFWETAARYAKAQKSD